MTFSAQIAVTYGYEMYTCVDYNDSVPRVRLKRLPRKRLQQSKRALKDQVYTASDVSSRLMAVETLGGAR